MGHAGRDADDGPALGWLRFEWCNDIDEASKLARDSVQVERSFKSVRRNACPVELVIAEPDRPYHEGVATERPQRESANDITS